MDYLDIIEKNKNEMIGALAETVRIKSVLDAPVFYDNNQLPFGKGVHEVFENTLRLGESMGFRTSNVDNYGGHIDFIGEENAKQTFGIIGHLDVVPEGDNWNYDPYGAEIADNYMYGRGTTDDKGPLIACLYAMKAIKEAGIIPKKNIRLILGLDEETGWKGIEYYFDRVEAPDFGITPDADFPAINGEKGIIYFSLAKKFSDGKSNKGLELSSLKGGNAPNMVPDYARAVLRCEDRSVYEDIKKIGGGFAKERETKLNFRGVGKSLEIIAHGKSAHGAHPELGKNAISIMMEFLGRLNFAFDETNDFISLYNDRIGYDVYGEKLGINLSDEPSGKLTVNVGMIEMDKKAVQVVINARYPVTYTHEDVYERLEKSLINENVGIIKEKLQEPIYKSPEDEMIKTLMEVYQKHTGDYESKPLVIGGGTYARSTKNIVAFGGAFPGDEDRMHQRDERIDLDKFVLMAKIYADAIYKLTCV
jgi:succinyl-diaminopimelate desuccinylase